MQFDASAFGYICEKYVCVCSKSKLGPVRLGVERNVAWKIRSLRTEVHVRAPLKNSVW